MKLTRIERNGNRCVLVESERIVIETSKDILDLVANAYYETKTNAIVISKDLISESFFNLSSGVLGDVLHKIKGYNARIAIYGDFSNESKEFKEFAHECDKGEIAYFTRTEDEAINIITK